MPITYVYPKGTESYWTHLNCAIVLSGTHRGNRYCQTHSVRVAAKDAEETRLGVMWH